MREESGRLGGLHSSDLFSWSQMMSTSLGASLINSFVGGGGVAVVVLSAGEASLVLLYLEAGVKLTFHGCHH